MLNLGFIYGHKRDKYNHPVIVIDCGLILKNEDKIDLLVGATNFFIDYTINKAMIPGQIENWTAIFDMNAVGLTKMSSKHIQ